MANEPTSVPRGGDPRSKAAAGQDQAPESRAEEQFRQLADMIPQLTWIADADGWIFWYNRRWYDYTGTTPEQMEGWGWQSVHDANELPRVLDRWRDSIQKGQPLDMVFPLKGADGVFRPFLTRIVPMFDAEGKVYRWFGTNTDITELKDAQAALYDSEERLRLALDAAQMATFDYRIGSDKVLLDERTRERLGIRPGEHLHYAEAMRAVHADDRERVEAEGRSAMRPGGTGRFESEHRVVQPDGSIQWVLVKGRVSFEGEGAERHPVRLTGVAIDITQRKTAEEQIGRQRDLIVQLSTPVLCAEEGLLIVPLIGPVDAARARQLTEQLLREIRDQRAKAVVIDLTGVPAIDTAAANHLMLTAQAAKLIGATTIISGISRNTAHSLVSLGIGLRNLRTTVDLRSGIEEARAILDLRHAETGDEN